MRRTLIATLGLAGALAGATPALAASREAAALKRTLGPGARVADHRETGKVRFVGSAPGDPIARPSGLSATDSPATVARAFLTRQADAFGLAGRGQALRVTGTAGGARGRSAVRLQQLEDGVPVLGGEFVVNLDAQRNILSAAGEALPEAVATTPAVTSTAARDTAIAAIAKEHGVAAPRLRADIPSLAIYDPAILGGPGPKSAVLVWRLEVKGVSGMPVDELVLVDARTGLVALSIDQIEEMKDRRVCDANQGTGAPNAYPCNTPVRSEGQGPVASPADVNQAYDFAGDTYDFFFSRFGRDSLDGQGLPLKSTVRFCPSQAAQDCPYPNAFWDGSQMVYGEGFAVDDVVGHELTHGVTDFSAHLFYYYQSGAINESLSDVFGELIDQTNGSEPAQTRWLIGEDIPGFPNGFRDMEDPESRNDPATMTSANYHGDETDNGGVHTNSGVSNHAAFLMTDGGGSVTGLGITKVARIYYEVQTRMLTSAGDYADLASALPQACTNLIGTAGIAAGDCTEVSDAVAAVQMNAIPPRAPNPEAPVCGTGLVPSNLFSDDLENTASGNWVAESGWYYPQNPNPSPIGDATYATSGTKNFFGYDRTAAGAFSISMTRNVAIPAGSTAFLRFNHAYGFENSGATGYDGGVLEISVNGGTFQDIGARLTDGGYNGTLTTTSNNPIEGRPAFVRESNGYVSSRATLTGLGGQSVRFRFLIGTDEGNLNANQRPDIYGWFVDDIRVYTCAPPTPSGSGGDGVPSPAPTAEDTTTTTTTTTLTPPGGSAAATLASARLRSCRLAGRGRRARLRCRLSGFRAVRSARVTVKRGTRTVATGSGKPSAKGVVTIRPRRALRKGRYKVTIKLRDAKGATRTLTARLRVR